MAKKNRNTFAKRQKEFKRMQKAQEKREKRLARKQKANDTGDALADETGSAAEQAVPENPEPNSEG